MDQVESWTPYPGGAPANVAAALGRLKTKVSFISAMGDDDLGQHMMELLQSEPCVQWCNHTTRGVVCYSFTVQPQDHT